MNRKKRSKPNSGTKGFGGGSEGSTSATAPGTTNKDSNTAVASTTTPTTLIQPKQPPSNFKYAGSIRPGLQSPKRSVPSFSSSGKKIIFPDYSMDGKPKARPALFPWIIEVKKPEEIEKMKRAGRVAREVLDLAGRSIGVGITTWEYLKTVSSFRSSFYKIKIQSFIDRIEYFPLLHNIIKVMKSIGSYTRPPSIAARIHLLWTTAVSQKVVALP